MCSPSLEMAGSRASGKTSSGDPPNRGTFQIAGSPPRSETNAIVEPSGYHAGSRSADGWSVSCSGFPPPESASHTSGFPDSLEMYAIIVPSGERAGSVSHPGALVIWRGLQPIEVFDVGGELRDFHPTTAATATAIAPPTAYHFPNFRGRQRIGGGPEPVSDRSFLRVARTSRSISFALW